MPRLPVLKRDQLDPEAQAVWDRWVATRGAVSGPSAFLMHYPELAKRVGELGAHLRYNGVLAAADRELAILTAGREVEAAYEWAAHEPLGVQAGVSKDAIEVLRHQKTTDTLEPREALIIDLVRELYRDHTITSDVYTLAERTFGRKGVIELVVLAGYYGLIGYVLNAFEAELPAGMTPAFTR